MVAWNTPSSHHVNIVRGERHCQDEAHGSDDSGPSDGEADDQFRVTLCPGGEPAAELATRVGVVLVHRQPPGMLGVAIQPDIAIDRRLNYS